MELKRDQPRTWFNGETIMTHPEMARLVALAKKLGLEPADLERPLLDGLLERDRAGTPKYDDVMDTLDYVLESWASAMRTRGLEAQVYHLLDYHSPSEIEAMLRELAE